MVTGSKDWSPQTVLHRFSEVILLLGTVGVGEEG